MKVVSMGVGSFLLLITGVLVQGFPQLNLTHWLIIGWLAVVNATFALGNLTLRTQSTVESNIINNAMLIQIAVLAWLFLDEPLTIQEIFGRLLVACDAVIVQLRIRKRS